MASDTYTLQEFQKVITLSGLSPTTATEPATPWIPNPTYLEVETDDPSKYQVSELGL